MKHEGRFSRIISAIFGNKIAVRENLFYDSMKGSLDFAPDDLPNWRAVTAITPGGGGVPVVTNIIGGTTTNPITVPYPSGFVDPSIICRNNDGSNYAGATNSVDNAYAGSPSNSITLTGDDNGSGKFADSFVFIIKP